MNLNKLFSEDIKILNVGSPSFNKDYKRQAVEYVHVDWKIPANGDEAILQALKKIYANLDKVKLANEKAIKNVKLSNAYLVGVKKAIDVIPNMTSHTILHAGPFIAWERMAGPAQGAIIGALMYEGLAETKEDAIQLIENNKITFSPCHEHSAVGPMAGIISASMPVHVIHNEYNDTYAYATINEGLGKVLRYGANSSEVIKRLKWMEEVLAPVLDEALHKVEKIDIKNLIAQGLQMGDECHNRNKAATATFLKEIITPILKTGFTMAIKEEAIDFLVKNEHYFLNLSMPACKVMLDTATRIKNSSLVTVMARNGVDFGIKVSGLGNTWYTYQANYIEGLYFSGYSQKNAARDIGDSAITETFGIGGFCMGAAPAIVQFVGGNVEDAIGFTKTMYTITMSENKNYMLPAVDFKGIPQGIDLLKVVESGVLPVINTGIAHKEAGVGQIGAGIVHPPFEVFKKAILAFAANMEDDEWLKY
ncbi:MAG: DUF1116 domain-containing protein [Breznakia sp.]